MDWNQWLIIVPARLRSSRLPEKPLADLCGRPLIARVYDRLQPLAAGGAKVIIATDSAKILSACQALGVACEITREDHESGTDRVHEVSLRYPKRGYVMNVQGDEPFVSPDVLEELARTMEASPHSQMGTVVYQNRSVEDFNNPNVVKAVISGKKALYFSRSAIPFHRDQGFESFWQHQGIYAFRQSILNEFCTYPTHPLEKLEKLEQLRALGQGIDILTVESKFPAIGVDTPEDLEDARDLFSKV